MACALQAMLQMQGGDMQQALKLQMQAAAAHWPSSPPYMPAAAMWPLQMYNNSAWAAAQAAALAGCALALEAGMCVPACVCR